MNSISKVNGTPKVNRREYDLLQANLKLLVRRKGVSNKLIGKNKIRKLLHSYLFNI